MARHSVTQRRRALDIVFEADQKEILVPGLLKELLAERQVISTSQVPIQESGVRLVELIADNLYEIDGLIDEYSKWGLRRLALLDRAILRLGLAEICFDGLDIAVAVKEYSEIVRELGDTRSIGFITAIFNKAGEAFRSQQAATQAETASEVAVGTEAAVSVAECGDLTESEEPADSEDLTESEDEAESVISESEPDEAPDETDGITHS